MRHARRHGVGRCCVRGLRDAGDFAGDVDAGRVLLVLGEAALLTAVFAPLTARLYGRAG